MYSNLLITVHYFILSDQWNVCIYGYMCKVEDDGELFYSLDDGNTRFSDLLQLVEFYQLNRGVLPCKLKHHCARTTLWTHPKTPVQSPFDLSVCFMDFLKTFYSKARLIKPVPCPSTNPDVHLWPLWAPSHDHTHSQGDFGQIASAARALDGKLKWTLPV